MPEFLTVKELAELLRLKERKVYDLAASGAVPCSKVTGKLLFPEAEIRAWIAHGQSGPVGQPAPTRSPPDVVLGSHDPLLDWALRQSRAGLATYFDGSTDGLRRFVAGEGIAAGLHLIGADGSWNVAEVTAEAGDCDAVLLAFARRRRGLLVAPEMADRIGGLGDLPGCRFAPRPEETGSARLFRAELAAAGLSDDDLTRTAIAHSEEDAAFAVRQGLADVTFGLEALAGAHDLVFRPVTEERFDLLLDRRAAFAEPLQALLRFMRSEPFRAHAAQLAGYDVREAGAVRWNA